jgi:hypothetical protein
MRALPSTYRRAMRLGPMHWQRWPVAGGGARRKVALHGGGPGGAREGPGSGWAEAQALAVTMTGGGAGQSIRSPHGTELKRTST